MNDDAMTLPMASRIAGSHLQPAESRPGTQIHQNRDVSPLRVAARP
jgi:hypothetical protein